MNRQKSLCITSSPSKSELLYSPKESPCISLVLVFHTTRIWNINATFCQLIPQAKSLLLQARRSTTSASVAPHGCAMAVPWVRAALPGHRVPLHGTVSNVWAPWSLSGDADWDESKFVWSNGWGIQAWEVFALQFQTKKQRPILNDVSKAWINGYQHF